LTEPRDKPIAWVTGAGGLIGGYVANHPNHSARWRVVGLTRPDLDLTNQEAVNRRFREDSPALVIHCAAVSTAAACAKNPDRARRINIDVTRQLTELCANARMILLSTDLVFDGLKGNYTEADPTNPLTLYGETKIEAERIVLANPRHLVIRTSLNAGVSPTGDRSFAEQMRAAWQRGETLNLFTDEFRNPIPASVTARAIWELALADQARLTRPSATPTPSDGETDRARDSARSPRNPTASITLASGIFHLAGAERLSRLEIGQLLAAKWPELICRMEPASLRDFPGPRAADCSLNCARAQAMLSFPLPRFSEWLNGARTFLLAKGSGPHESGQECPRSSAS
jgi:dTDP-4-dehydrorhamnose reductase